jgi:hypothetical protein
LIAGHIVIITPHPGARRLLNVNTGWQTWSYGGAGTNQFPTEFQEIATGDILAVRS